MLRKLMKYEFKATARWFLPLYIAIVLFALINRFLFQPQAIGSANVLTIAKDILTVISIFLYAFSFMGTMVISLVVVVQRFYKSLLGDEGYLMFTLPVKAWQHTTNKLLIAMLWNILSCIIGLGSILIIVPSNELHSFINELPELIGFFGMRAIILIMLVLLVGFAGSILEIYAAIALGHLFNKHRIILSFAFYLGIKILNQIVYMVLLPFLINPYIDITMNSTITEVNIKYNSSPNMNFEPQLVAFAVIILISSSILTAGYFITTNYLLKSKLNLE